jgi:hypothetical protein
VTVGVATAAGGSGAISCRVRRDEGLPAAAAATFVTRCTTFATGAAAGGIRFTIGAAWNAATRVTVAFAGAWRWTAWCAGATGAASTGVGAAAAGSGIASWPAESGPSTRPGRMSNPATAAAISAPVAAWFHESLMVPPLQADNDYR